MKKIFVTAAFCLLMLPVAAEANSVHSYVYHDGQPQNTYNNNNTVSHSAPVTSYVYGQSQNNNSSIQNLGTVDNPASNTVAPSNSYNNNIVSNSPPSNSYNDGTPTNSYRQNSYNH